MQKNRPERKTTRDYESTNEVHLYIVADAHVPVRTDLIKKGFQEYIAHIACDGHAACRSVG